MDDTDSRRGMCTTYVGAVLRDRLARLGVAFVGYSRLIRLNPSCPFKTRGNCAVALSFNVSGGLLPLVRRITLDTVRELAELGCKSTNPGVVFFFGGTIPPSLRAFSLRVVRELVTLEEAEELAKREGVEYYRFKIGRGVIGALAAVGMPLELTSSFEFIAYRTPEYRGSRRRVDTASVTEMGLTTKGETFDNLDPFSGEVRITPHTPCPVFYGIRGESAVAVFRAHNIIKVYEPVERCMIYKTNQATDMHLQTVGSDVIPSYSSVALIGRVCRAPVVAIGGQIAFKLRDDGGSVVDCVAYEPTRAFRRVVEQLVVGDFVRVCGAAKRRMGLPITVNLERLEIYELARVKRASAPLCANCGSRMASIGRLGGYVCRECGHESGIWSGVVEEVDREARCGVYEVPPRARRHLAWPLARTSAKRVY